jgi:hypothetical protein
MGVLIFILAMIWGSLSAQFLMQTVTSLILASIYLAGVAFSKVSRTVNGAGTLATLAQVLVFGAVFLSGNWFASHYVDYSSFNTASVASGLSFVATIIYVAPRVPGKILLARMRASVPSFGEASMHIPATERVEFARKIARWQWPGRASGLRGRDNVKDLRGKAFEGHEPTPADSENQCVRQELN